MGGDKSLEQHITIPISHLNLAWPGAHSYDLPDQAVDLVKILEKHVDKNSIQNDWKLLNLFIGTNDLCQYCSNPKKHTKEYFSNNIKKAIQTIKQSIPRVIVNLIVIFHLDLVRQVDATPICQGLHT
uniref:Phospholipase B1, membrane-associated-like n=1 Tax=Acrobeloides nanus TaxID=290746 RepID=A0A914DBC1_9BILA